ncbi:hypothetical protein DEU56DRAFT_977229 [Suillus clintonianus]|uniref:uncharacterized protein n=1 Tax=Suillus clintonianus TaxID=1904413 RepID=UPI001B874EE9|nr:uncharacterized protein DEU56DRAFT_977229 [Suillus clintonianus]KAG2152845.1 hypothetical protein DEU56DRAFT_977229 [Suillus clintonianus]
MTMVLIAPELIIAWASRQFFSAIAIAKRFNDASSAQPAEAHDHHPESSGALRPAEDALSAQPAEAHDHHPESSGALRPAEFRDWTITHGFFVWMGGFILYVDGQPRATLTPDELLHFVLQGSVDMPVIPKADIKDRSKGDIISKGIAILQLVWFICQLVARHVQNLPISLLEVDTLAVAVLTFIAYLWWWWKPKDVGRPYIVHWKGKALPLSNFTFTYDEADSRFSNAGCSRYLFYLIYPWLSSAGMGPIMSPSAAHSRRVASLGGYGGPGDFIITLIVISGHGRSISSDSASVESAALFSYLPAHTFNVEYNETRYETYHTKYIV